MKKVFGLLFTILTPTLVWAQAVPQGSLRVSPNTGDLSSVFTLDASASRSSQGGNNNLVYQFKPSPNSPTSTFQSSPTYRFKASKTGTFNAQVIVYDTVSGGATASYQTYTVREELQRDIRISVSELNPIEGNDVTFTVTVFGNGFNRQELQSRWDFESDGVWDTPFRTGLSASYNPVVSSASPTVEVRFPDGQIIRGQGIYPTPSSLSRNRLTQADRTPVEVQSLPLDPPVLQVQPSYLDPSVNTLFTFDGSDTQMTAGSYLEWIIEGQTITNKTVVEHQFKSGGEQKVSLRHCLGQNDPVCLTTSTVIALKSEPNDQFLDISWQNLSDRGRTNQHLDYALLTASDTIRFTVRALGTPTPGQKFKYRWDFNSDGVWDTNFNESSSTEHPYQAVGNFIATVEADPALKTKNFTRLTQAIPVYVERNRAPQGTFDFRREGHYVRERVYYTAEVFDPQSGQQVEVRFDSDADGVWDSDFRRQLSWYWVYDVPGDYLVRMQLRDPQGRVSEVKKTVTILPLPQPEAKAVVSHRTQTEGKNITLNAGNSLGRNLTYQWKVLGQTELQLPSSSRASVKLPAGDYTVRLTVRDGLGLEDTVEFPVTFAPAQSLAASPPNTNLSAEAPPNILQWIPGTPSLQKKFIVPTGGVPSSASPFVVEAGTAIPNDGFVSSMRAGR